MYSGKDDPFPPSPNFEKIKYQTLLQTVTATVQATLRFIPISRYLAEPFQFQEVRSRL